MLYLHGKGNLIPGLENALLEQESGNKLNVSIPPEEAYGVRNPDLQQEVPLDRFSVLGFPRSGVGVIGDRDTHRHADQHPA